MTRKRLIERRQQFDPLLAQGRKVTADTTEHHHPNFSAETPRDLLLHFDHLKISLRLVVVKRNSKIVQEPQHGPLPVLATCDIRRPELACENTSFYLLLLADCPEEEYHLKYASAHLHKGGMDTVQGILTFLTRLTGLCLQLLQHRFVVWTTPDTASLLLGTLTDLARSKSQLVAENALLR